MPTRRFEGRSLEDALARASSEVGSDARVVGAERVRSGGIGGFFARERVEIEVELDDMPAAPDAPEPPASLLDLADRVSSVEIREARTTIHSDPPVSRRAKAHTPPPPPPPPPAEEPASTPTNVTPDSIDTGTPVIVGAPPTPLPVVPHVSTETPTFAEILERITAETGGRDEKAEAVATTPVAPAPPVAEQPLVAEAPVPAPASPPPVQLIVRPAPPAPLAFPRPESGGPLARLGLPPELEPTGPDLRDALVAQLASLPQPPPLPSSRGTVIAVVGAPGLAYQAARTIRGRVATDAAIATFSRRPSSDDGIDEVSDQRRAWRRRPGPTVAVVDAPVGRPTEWASEALCALEPTAVWGVVEASRKVEDVAAWSASLGGVDALCLSGLDDTVSPAAALRTGLPVALLEGQPATAERWADVLLARLPEADHALKEPACSDR